MSASPTRILLIQDDPRGVRMIRDLLNEVDAFVFDLIQAPELGGALARISLREIDVILLNLSLSNPRGFEALRWIVSEAGSIPIIILADLDDKALALEAITAGAQDCLVKGHFNGRALERVIRYAIERKRTEAHLKLAADALRLLNRTNDLSLLAEDLLRLIRETLDFEAIGLRLRQGEDFPYYVQMGFSDDFIKDESSLCVKGHGEAGARDAENCSLYANIYGAVLSGKGGCALPGLTESGSFWANDSSALLALVPSADPQDRQRNRCLRAGFQSIALIPLRSGPDIIGLLQLNDTRPQRFTPELISLLEGLAESIGIALRRQQAQTALRESEDKFKYVFDHSDFGKSITLPTGEVSVNRAFADLLGYAPEELRGKRWQELTHPADVAGDESALEPLLKGERESTTFEKRYVRKDGEVVWAHVSTSLRRDADGHPLYFFTTVVDITARKKSEEQIASQLDELRRWHEATRGREHRVLELKREVNALLAERGCPARYASAGPDPSREGRP